MRHKSLLTRTPMSPNDIDISFYRGLELVGDGIAKGILAAMLHRYYPLISVAAVSVSAVRSQAWMVQYTRYSSARVY